jgi:SAM-dependent methyltransferase
MASVEHEPGPSGQLIPDTSAVMAKNERAWEDWARIDPLWAVVTASDKKHGRWDLDEFFRSGQDTIDSLIEEGAAYGVPAHCGRALDFGCGVGRLTRALGTHMTHVLGLDVSGLMIEQAMVLNSGRSGIEFAVHRDADFHVIEDNSLDIVCSLLVLQHIPSIALIENYLREFARVLAPGGFLFMNLPVGVPSPDLSLRGRLRPRTRFPTFLRRLGVSPALLYRHFNWNPDMPMNALPIERVRSILTEAGGRVLESRVDDDGGGVYQGLYLVTC